MSMTGDWGLCKKSSYDILQTAVITGDFEAAAVAVKMICSELEGSAPEVETAACSGEIFIALFHYFQVSLEIDVRAQENFSKLGEIWREETGDFDMIPFAETERARFLSLAETIDFDEVIQFVNDFFQADFGEAGKIACSNLFENLKRQQPGYVLVWRLR